MKRQDWYPGRLSNQIPWLENFRDKVPDYQATLELDADEVTDAVAGARFLIYVLSQWLPSVRTFGPSSTEAMDLLMSGTGGAAITLPTFTAPTLPTGVVPVAPGVLTRIFKLVEDIKNADNYTETIGQDLGIIGAVMAGDEITPTIKLKVVAGTVWQMVIIQFVKFGHMGVYLECRRNGGAWEFLGIDTESPYQDERALLVPGVPEIREYRARFWDKGTPNGEWTDVAKTTVAP